MRTQLSNALIGAALTFAAANPLAAHHAFGGEFDPSKPVVLKGPITRVEWVNPHSWIHLEVTRPDGTKEQWMVEGGSPNSLLRRGVTKEALAIGTVIVVDGYQARDHSLRRANGRNITYADGRKLFLGSSGTGAPQDGADPVEAAKPGGRSGPSVQDTAAAIPERNSYGDSATWLCRPRRAGRPGDHAGKDACDVDLTTTIVAADGRLTQETWSANPQAPVDCFYVYPTVSTDPTPNSDMTADAAERNVIHQQFARFASKCRLYAPLYRQVTLAGLRRQMAGGRPVLDRGLGYDDVRDAWNYYLEHDNNGRGFVLIGHSQGSFILAELIRREIDGKPVQSRLVSAILLGTTLAVPRGKDVGGAFLHVPLCRAASQSGCVVTFASFRSTVPPPADTLFGKVTESNMVAACTNPAALGGGSGALHAYLSTTGRTIVGTSPPKPWVTPERPIATPWVSVPGLLSAKCTANEHATYLEVSVLSHPSDPRADDITGDLSANGQVLANWGLHLIDVNLAMGNLVDLVGQQAHAYAARASSTR
jgi:hypothetical protein